MSQLEMRRRPPNRLGGPRRPEAPGVFGGVRTHYATDAGRDILINDPDGWEVSQPWLWWVDGPGNAGPDALPSETLWGNPPPGAWPRMPVPPAVTRCTSLIADTLGGMPWQVRQGRDRVEAPEWINDPQQKRRDRRVYGGPLPQWRLSPVEFRAKSVKSMLWAGESVWYVPQRDANDDPAPPIWQLNPAYIDIDGGEYVIPPTNDVSLELAELGPEVSEGYRFADGELIVIRGMLGDGLRGLSVLDAHLLELALAGMISGFALNALRRGVPNGYLKVNAPNLTDPQAKKLQGEWMRAHGGLMRRVAVLNATTEFHAINLDPQALQLAQMRDYSVVDWCLIFGVNPYMLGTTQDRSTYANVESRMTEFAEFTLLPWARRVESACDAELPRGSNMRINLDSLKRADTLARYQAHKIGLDAEFLTVDEVRDMEDRPAMPVEQADEAVAAAAEAARLRLVGGAPT